VEYLYLLNDLKKLISVFFKPFTRYFSDFNVSRHLRRHGIVGMVFWWKNSASPGCVDPQFWGLNGSPAEWQMKNGYDHRIG